MSKIIDWAEPVDIDDSSEQELDRDAEYQLYLDEREEEALSYQIEHES